MKESEPRYGSGRALERADAVEVGLYLKEVADVDPVKLHV